MFSQILYYQPEFSKCYSFIYTKNINYKHIPILCMYIKHTYSSIIDRWKCREIINFRDFSAASESAGKFKNKYMRYRKYTMSKMQRPSRK